MSKVINSHRHFYSPLVDLPIIHNHASIVYQYINMTELSLNNFCEVLNGSPLRQIKLKSFYLPLWVWSWFGDEIYSLHISLLISTSENDGVTISIQSPRCFKSYANISTCNNNILLLCWHTSCLICVALIFKQGNKEQPSEKLK